MINKLIELVRQAAHNARENAGYNGGWSDGGASLMEEQIKFYQYGRDGIVPPEWRKYEDQLDPEYQEYLRLVKKFQK